MIDIYEAMSTLRAVRRLRSDPIPDDVLDRVLQAACWAPTGANIQPWRVVVVRDAEKRIALQKMYAPEWAKYTDGFGDRMANMDPGSREKALRTLAAGNHLAEHLAEAPVHLVFCADPRRMAITDAGLDRVSMVGGGSVYPSVQNALLACRAEGLGCVLTTLLCFREHDVKALLGVPEPWATVAMVPIGYPVGRGHGPISRGGPSEVAYDNTFYEKWS